MFVRVFDKDKNTYYKSVVYARLLMKGCPWRFIVLNPYANTFELVDTYDISVSPIVYLVEIIQSDTSDFTFYEEASLLKYKHYREKIGVEFTDLQWMGGYHDVCEDYAFLTDIFAKKSVPADRYAIAIRELKDKSEWNYILSQADADAFMKKFVGFHDSTLEKVHYSETDDTVTANVIFDNSIWFGVVELCFEGVQMLKIMPSSSGYCRDLFEASLIIENESVFWADKYMEKPDNSYEGSIIRALNLKWRKIQ